MNVDSTAYRELAEKEDKLQKQILQLSEENIELKFEVEQARKDIPRLKVINTNFTRTTDFEYSFSMKQKFIGDGRTVYVVIQRFNNIVVAADPQHEGCCLKS